MEFQDRDEFDTSMPVVDNMQRIIVKMDAMYLRLIQSKAGIRMCQGTLYTLCERNQLSKLISGEIEIL